MKIQILFYMGSEISTNITPVMDQPATCINMYRLFITECFNSVFYNSEALSQYEPAERYNLISESIDKIYFVLNRRIHEIITFDSIQGIHYIINLITDIRNVKNILEINNDSHFSSKIRAGDLLREMESADEIGTDKYLIERVNKIQFFKLILNVNEFVECLKNLVQHVNNICLKNAILDTLEVQQRIERNVHHLMDLQDVYCIMQDIIFIIRNGNFPVRYISEIINMMENLYDMQDNIKQKYASYSNSLQKEKLLAKSDECCAICLKNYTKERVILILKCNHSFDEECIKKWFKHQRTCPICRRVVKV